MLPTADKIASLIFPACFWQIHPQLAAKVRELSLPAIHQKAMSFDVRQLIKFLPPRRVI